MFPETGPGPTIGPATLAAATRRTRSVVCSRPPSLSNAQNACLVRQRCSARIAAAMPLTTAINLPKCSSLERHLSQCPLSQNAAFDLGIVQANLDQIADAHQALHAVLRHHDNVAEAPFRHHAQYG